MFSEDLLLLPSFRPGLTFVSLKIQCHIYSVHALCRVATTDLETFKFFVVGIHTQPRNAVNEINALVDVYYVCKNNENDPGVGFIMGDFNYGANYVGTDKLDNLNIDKSQLFIRLINKNYATTVLPSWPPFNKKPYDRIYVALYGPQTIIEAVGVDYFRNGMTEREVSYIIQSVQQQYIIIILMYFLKNAHSTFGL